MLLPGSASLELSWWGCSVCCSGGPMACLITFLHADIMLQARKPGRVPPLFDLRVVLLSCLEQAGLISCLLDGCWWKVVGWQPCRGLQSVREGGREGGGWWVGSRYWGGFFSLDLPLGLFPGRFCRARTCHICLCNRASRPKQYVSKDGGRHPNKHSTRCGKDMGEPYQLPTATMAFCLFLGAQRSFVCFSVACFCVLHILPCVACTDHQGQCTAHLIMPGPQGFSLPGALLAFFGWGRQRLASAKGSFCVFASAAASQGWLR